MVVEFGSNDKPKQIVQDAVLVIFEGSDMAGKTSTMNSVKDFIAKYIAGRNTNLRCGDVPTFKFPVYDSVLGSSILDHLTSFKPSTLVSENMDKIIKFSSMQCVNKSANLFKLMSKFEYSNIVLCDRGFLSQYIYDIAWLKEEEKWLDEQYAKCFKKFALYNALSVKDALIETAKSCGINLHILTEVFVGNDPIINYVINRTKTLNRRVDNYDTMLDYKQAVFNEFYRITKDPDNCTSEEKRLIESRLSSMRYSINSVTETYLKANNIKYDNKASILATSDGEWPAIIDSNIFNDECNNFARKVMCHNIVEDILKELDFDIKDFVDFVKE